MVVWQVAVPVTDAAPQGTDRVPAGAPVLVTTGMTSVVVMAKASEVVEFRRG